MLLGVLVRPAASRQGSDPPPPAATLFERSCSGCHNGDDPRAPTMDALRGRSPQAILDALTAGSMRYQGLALSGEERRAVAEFLSGRKLRGTVAGVTAGACAPRPPFVDPAAKPLWNGWGVSLENTHAQPASQAGLTADQVRRLHLKWAFGFPDTTSAWAQPTVAGGRLFVGSQNGTVYALDAVRGCVVWTFAAHGAVRASISIGRRPGATRQSTYAAYFSDQQGFVYALDAATGRRLWERKVEDHPLVRLTGAPALYQDRLFVPTSSYEEGGKTPGYACCTFRGSLVALDVRNGDLVWKTFTIAEEPHLLRVYADGTELRGPAGAAIWSAPTIDVKRSAIYVGTGNTYSGVAQPTADAILAFDLKSGRLRWAHQMPTTTPDVFGCSVGEINCGERPGPDFDFGASPILATLGSGRQLIVAGQKSGVVYALDPDRKGQQVWRYRAGGGSGLGGIQWGIAADAERVYVPVAEIYNPAPGGLHAVDLATGARAWFAPPVEPLPCGKLSRSCSGAQFSAVTTIPGVVFSPSNDGAIRAYSAQDGAIVWQFDTNRDFPTLNGVRAKGGSMSGPAPVIAGGFLYISSGYGAFGLRPGNVLLAFSAD
ncbi:MAG TPA: PQQ-binding-like beta-propeller repeat protein [Vicinamibacterales bacterium]|nr:PQQ-binding-like beta-propeller repeat protein [Vicinamibacterales bacterium]